jgi:hypothetical protein
MMVLGPDFSLGNSETKVMDYIFLYFYQPKMLKGGTSIRVLFQIRFLQQTDYIIFNAASFMLNFNR